MENDYLNILAGIVLPAQILEYFSIVGIEQNSTEIHISLDEKMNPELSNDVHFESKGFMEAVSVTDFPIRDHKVILKIRRRRWTDTRTGKSFSIPIDLDIVAKGTRYSREFGAFLKRRMETSPVTCHTLEEFYHIDGHTFEKQYKEVLSGFRQWDQLEHAAEWLLFPENVGPRLAIDESSLSNGELYTFVTNREAHTRGQSLVAVVAGTKAEDVIAVLQRIDEERRNAVYVYLFDLSDSMRKIVWTAFPKASRVIDRFHIQKLACDAVQELRVKHRWDAIQQANDEMEEARQKGKEYNPYRFPNGDTRKELLIRSRYLLFKSADKWTDRQKQRAAILFEEYPDIQTAYGLCHSLRMIFAKNTIKNAARLSMARWYNKVEKAGFHSFNIIATTFHEHYEEILNFYNNRSSNALAESFNAKVKLFRANLRGVADKKFFLFRIAKLYAYPH